MELRTHLAISPSLVGEPIRAEPNHAVCQLLTSAPMAADERGLVHGGFVFGLADYAAMIAVGDPNVVLGAADVRFLAPVAVGQLVTATAVATGEGKKRIATVVATASTPSGDDEGEPRGSRDVFRGTFTCFILEHHVFDSASGKEQP